MNEYSLLLNNYSQMNNKIKIMTLLLKNPLSFYNINQISRVLNISVGSVHKILKELEKEEILRGIRLGNAIYYKLNFSNQETIKMASLILIENKKAVLKTNHIAKIYSRELEKIKAKIAIIFGSILTKREKANDIDVLFVVAKKEEAKKIYAECSELSKLKTKPIVPLILTKKDLIEKIEKREKIVLNIIKEGIVLFGEENFIKTLSKTKWQI